jgi:hypothetical protein
MRLWDVATGELLEVFDGHTDNIWHVSFSPDGDHVLSVSMDGTVRIWGLSSGICRCCPTSGWVTGAWISEDNRTLVAATSTRMFRWDPDTSRKPVEPVIGEHPGGPAYAIDVSPDGQLVVTGNGDSTVRLWDARTWQIVTTLPSPGLGTVTAVRFNPQGTWLATGTRDGKIKLAPVAPRSPAALQLCRPRSAVQLARPQQDAAALLGLADGDLHRARNLLSTVRAMPALGQTALAGDAWRTLGRHTGRATLRDVVLERTLAGHDGTVGARPTAGASSRGQRTGRSACGTWTAGSAGESSTACRGRLTVWTSAWTRPGSAALTGPMV